MSNRTIQLTDTLRNYLLEVSLREPELLRQLRAETAKEEEARMQIAPEQGQFMALLLKILGARRCIEIGVFTGYSALCTAKVLPDDGLLIACDVNRNWTDIARRYWRLAGVDRKIDLRLAPAADTLAQLLAEGAGGSFDFVFIDADKRHYDLYYEQSLMLLRPGGLIAIDNVLWKGSVVDSSIHDEDTEAIRALNRKIHTDDRVDLSLVPIADGLTLVRKHRPESS